MTQQINGNQKIQYMKKEAKKLLSFFQQQPDFKINTLGNAQDVISVCQGYPNWHVAQKRLSEVSSNNIEESNLQKFENYVIFPEKDNIPYFENNNTFSTFYLIQPNIKNEELLTHSIKNFTDIIEYFLRLTQSTFSLYISIKKHEDLTLEIPYSSDMKVSHETYLKKIDSRYNVLSIILELKSTSWDSHRIFSELEPMENCQRLKSLETHIFNSFVSSDDLEKIDIKDNKLQNLFNINKNYNYLKLLSNLSSYISLFDNPKDSFEVIFKNSFKDLFLVHNKKLLDLAINLSSKLSLYEKYPEVDFENLILDYQNIIKNDVARFPIVDSINKMPLSMNYKEKNLILGLPGTGKSKLLKDIIYSYIISTKNINFQLFYLNFSGEKLKTDLSNMFKDDSYIIKNYHSLVLNNDFKFNIFKPSYYGNKITSEQLHIIAKILNNIPPFLKDKKQDMKSDNSTDLSDVIYILKDFYKQTTDFNLSSFCNYCKNHHHFSRVKSLIENLDSLDENYRVIFSEDDISDNLLLNASKYRIIELLYQNDIVRDINFHPALLTHLITIQISKGTENHYCYDEVSSFFFKTHLPILKGINYTCATQYHNEELISNISNMLDNIFVNMLPPPGKSPFIPDLAQQPHGPNKDKHLYWVKYSKRENGFQNTVFQLTNSFKD